MLQFLFHAQNQLARSITILALLASLTLKALSYLIWDNLWTWEETPDEVITMLGHNDATVICFFLLKELNNRFNY
jgi:hypothetical protein